VGEGIAIRTATLTVVGELGLSSVTEIFVEWVLLPLSDDGGRGKVGIGGFKNILARVSVDGGVRLVGLGVESE
jgi:hypothetical protein